MPERSSPELPVCAEATVFQRAGGELQQRAEAELPVGASPELPTSAKRAVPGCGASVHWRQVDGPNKALSGSWVRLFVTSIWTYDPYTGGKEMDLRPSLILRRRIGDSLPTLYWEDFISR